MAVSEPNSAPAQVNDISGLVLASDEFITQMGLDYAGPELLDYDGDGNVTTMHHILWTSDLLPHVTIADVMDIRIDFNCAEYV